MSEDRPTTEEVVDALRNWELGENDLLSWLAEERRAAAEKAWDDAMTFIYANAWVSLDPGKAPVENPYRAKEAKA